jgi:hypothetical protein
MSLVFARDGSRMVMLEEIPRVSSPDVLINGILAELKSLTCKHSEVCEEGSSSSGSGDSVVPLD